MRLPVASRATLIACAFALAASLAVPAHADIFMFSTPSRNIECSVGEGEVSSDIRCTIFERQGETALPRPAGCSGAWGHLFELDERGPVRMSCGAPGGKNTASYVEIAEYGVTGRFGGITCVSQQTGFECRNADGHGFHLSRGSQTVH